MATKIDFNTWAGLQNGRIAYIAEGGPVSPHLTYEKARDAFVMSKYVNGDKQVKELLGSITDDKRLNAHWQEFAGK